MCTPERGTLHEYEQILAQQRQANQQKHLEMLQAAIARLAGNSFAIKGWAVALVAVLGGFAAKDADPRFVFALWLPETVSGRLLRWVEPLRVKPTGTHTSAGR